MSRPVLYVSALALFSSAALFGQKYWACCLRFLESTTEPVARAEPEVDVHQLLNSLDEATSRLVALSARRTGDSPAEAEALLDRVVQGHAELAENSQHDHQFQQSRWNLLYATYAAARVDPGTHRRAFDELTSELFSEDPRSDLAANAALLQLLLRHDFKRPTTPQLLLDLNQFAAAYSPRLGVRGFQLVAGELVQEGQREIARTVLQHGIKIYQLRSEGRVLSGLLAKVDPFPKNASAAMTVRWDSAAMPLPARLRSSTKSSIRGCKPRRGRR